LRDAFPARATELLAALEPDREFEFVVGAFPGYSSYQSNIQLRRLLPLEPDLVVFYVGARNDSNRHRYFRDDAIGARRARLDAGWHRVRFLRLFEALWDRLYKSVFRKLLSFESRARVPPDAFRANVVLMAEQVERAGIPALFVLPPVSRELLRREPIAERYREVLADVARARGIGMVSLQPAFESADPIGLYFDDGYHFDVEGHALAARAIRDAISANGLIARD
jgi:lysophospholipase L1-like esterase